MLDQNGRIVRTVLLMGFPRDRIEVHKQVIPEGIHYFGHSAGGHARFSVTKSP
jgi:hypothetical protein